MAGISARSFQPEELSHRVPHPAFVLRDAGAGLPPDEPLLDRCINPFGLRRRMRFRKRTRRGQCIVVPLSPGGFADTPARAAPRLSEQMGRQFFVENKPGAGGTIGADFVAKSVPDGYTLLLTGTPHVISAHLYKKMPYDALKDFSHIALDRLGALRAVVNPQNCSHLGTRADRSRKSAAGQDRFRELRQRQRAASRRRALQLDGGDRPQPRAVQGQRPGDAGSDRGTGRRVLRRHSERARPREVGAAASARRDDRQALERASRSRRSPKPVSAYEATLWLNVSGPRGCRPRSCSG